MKKIFRKKIFAFFLSALLVLALSLPVFADMGPKPSVTLKLYYTPGQRYAVTLLGNTRVSGPWGSAAFAPGEKARFPSRSRALFLRGIYSKATILYY